MIRFGYDAVGFVVGDVAISARGAVLHLAVTAAHENGVVRFVGDGEPFLRRQLPQNLFRFVDFYDTATNQAEGVDPAKRDGRGAQVLADVVPELGFLPLVKRVNHQLQLVLTTLRQRSRALECRRPGLVVRFVWAGRGAILLGLRNNVQRLLRAQQTFLQRLPHRSHGYKKLACAVFFFHFRHQLFAHRVQLLCVARRHHRV
mmetsp:Transcript_4957/g.9041  ORF Transcript_4957/g.9041 Transcript_4957/m.9041 type:complete len:202 (+) Transcript_4957:774-1379(+)